MTEEQVKFLCKWMVDNGNRPLTEFELILKLFMRSVAYQVQKKKAVRRFFQN